MLPLLLLLSTLGVGILDCSGDTTGPAPRSASQAYWALQLNYHAINLALTTPYNTAHLTAIPLTATGASLTGLGLATFRAGDSTVTVDSTGLVTAHYITPQTSVIASLIVQGVTLTDTVLIQVTDTAPQLPLDTFSLQPAKGDSAKRAVDFNFYHFAWPVTATNTAGATVCDTLQCPLQVYYASSDPRIATIDRRTGLVNTLHTGHVVFTATTLAYGVAKRDSVAFTVGNLLYPEVVMELSATGGTPKLLFDAPKELVLGVGAVITFQDVAVRHPADVIFDHPAAIEADSTQLFGCCVIGPPTGSGNIPAFGGDTVNVVPNDFASRRFPVAGTYRYHSSLFPSDTLEFIVQ